MAIKRLTIAGYGAVELNNVAFRRDGRIEAQCAIDTASLTEPVENGMLVAVDNVNRKLTAPTAGDVNEIYALVYSAEHIYDERTPGLNNFVNDTFLPRCGYLAVGDKYTTDCIAYNDTEFATETAFISALANCGTTALYCGKDASGAVVCGTAVPSYGPVLKVCAKTTMPAGTIGVKLQCIRA